MEGKVLVGRNFGAGVKIEKSSEVFVHMIFVTFNDLAGDSPHGAKIHSSDKMHEVNEHAVLF